MLPAGQRVRRREDFTAAVRQGRRVGSAGLVVHARIEPGGQTPRAGFIVGRAVGSAVRRNRLRRQLRHLVGPCLAALPVGTVLVIRAAAPAATFSRQQLAASLADLIDRAVARASGTHLVTS